MFGKPPFPDLLPVNRCVNDVKRVCRGRIQAALPPDFHDAQLENQTSDRLRIGGNLLVTNSSIDCESLMSGLSSPLISTCSHREALNVTKKKMAARTLVFYRYDTYRRRVILLFFWNRDIISSKNSYSKPVQSDHPLVQTKAAFVGRWSLFADSIHWSN